MFCEKKFKDEKNHWEVMSKWIFFSKQKLRKIKLILIFLKMEIKHL
jgi:hypothetical protein